MSDSHTSVEAINPYHGSALCISLYCMDQPLTSKAKHALRFSFDICMRGRAAPIPTTVQIDIDSMQVHS